jgi:two-component system chemotaxis response regulator CheY
MDSLAHLSRDISILVVDDLPSMRKIVKKILGQLGFHAIDEAPDGAGALQKLSQQKFDLIISGWDMPNMPGIELLRSVRANAELKTIPFVMMTSESKKESVIQAVEAGVTSYIVKPFNAEVMRQKLTGIYPADQPVKPRELKPSAVKSPGAK